MSFACWRKCDFQVHTPRDPNWEGARPIGTDEIDPATGNPADQATVDQARTAWAAAFIEQCEANDLAAIALTDHHEMIMVPYVQRAIEAKRKTDKGFDLWLFPGMELSCHGGVQCLILFDADLPAEWWQQAQGKLGIAYAAVDPWASKGQKVAQLTTNYAEIAGLLDELDDLKGRYIVLPNVSQGGQHTVLTDKNHTDFLRMPYVGGYLDRGQTLDTLGTKNRHRLSGDCKEWSKRYIYPLPTSDSRSADFSFLGSNNTWVKLAAPTAEAIRQAFLGHKSRISIVPPAVASLHVAAIEVGGSGILADTDLALSPELNSIIGGRGSGKSSLLEYLAFGLGRSSYDAPRDHYSETERMRDLIAETLVTQSGSVRLTVVQDGAVFSILRGPGTTHQPQITYPNGTTQPASVKELRSLFPAVVYSQGELAEIGKQAGKKAELSDLLQFVKPSYKKEDDALLHDIAAARSAVSIALQRLEENWRQRADLHKLITSRDTLRQRVDALEKTLPTLSPQDQQKVEYYDKADEFEGKRIQASKHADQIVQELSETASALGNKRDLATTLEDEARPIQERYDAIFQTFMEAIDGLVGKLEGQRAALTEAETEWDARFAQARAERDAVLEKLGAHKSVTAQIIRLREEIATLTNEINDLEAALSAQGDRSGQVKDALDALKAAVSSRATRTQEWAKEIESLSSGKIKAVVDAEGDISQIREALEDVAAKTGSQEATRIKEVDDVIRASGVWGLLDRMRTDCLALLYWKLLGAASGEEEPKCDNLLRVLGNTTRIRDALKERMDTARLTAIATATPKPNITLTYHDSGREISFEKASEGQRAAALLFMLLEQPGGPLIIDQPEGDLDNRIIADLTDKLHGAKSRRQIVFASHNANVVVNGSSEFVGHLEVTAKGTRQFECSGAIDDPAMRKVITGTMEGGEKAFKDRQDKYGY